MGNFVRSLFDKLSTEDNVEKLKEANKKISKSSNPFSFAKELKKASKILDDIDFKTK